MLKKYPYLVPEQEPIIIFDRKSAIYMGKNVKYTKHTRNISRRNSFLINGEYFNLHKTMWCEGGLKLADVVTKNGIEE